MRCAIRFIFPLLAALPAGLAGSLAAQAPTPAAASGAASSAAASAPSFCAQPEFDLGDQPAGAVLSHAFILRNPLDRAATLALTNHAGLSVTGVPASLAAGESAVVTLTTEPVNGIGEFSYIADLNAGDASAVPITLEMHGRVLQYFKTDPPDQQMLLTLAPGRTLRRGLTLARKDGRPFIVSGVRWEEVKAASTQAESAKRRTPGSEPADDELAGKFSFTGENGSAPAGWNGRVAAGPLAHPGLYFARLRIATDHPRQPEVIVDVVIRNLPPLVMFPGEIHFFNPVKRADIKAGKAPVRRLFVHALPGEPRFEPGAVSATPEFLGVRWTTEGTPRKDESVLEISLKPDAPPGVFHGEIRIARSAGPGDEEPVAVEGVILP